MFVDFDVKVIHVTCIFIDWLIWEIFKKPSRLSNDNFTQKFDLLTY
jgi:hypothetical protein